MANGINSFPATQAATTDTPDAKVDVPLVYLGRSQKEPLYYFLSVKDGYGRFLRFGFSPFYPFWVGGVNTGATHTVPDKLLLSDCPEGVVEEVQLFIQGKIKYEFEPSRKGRKARAIRIEVGQGDGSERKPASEGVSSSSVNPSSAKPTKVLGTEAGRSDDGVTGNAGSVRKTGRSRSSGGVAVPGRSPGANPPNHEVKKGATRSNTLLEEVPAASKTARVPKQKKPEIELAQNVDVSKRKRGRPAGSKNSKVNLPIPNSGEVSDIGAKASKVISSKTKRK